MVVTLPGWSPDLERSFKQVLFQFLEDVHCTKAALYLLGPDGSYLLVTQYGFGRRDMLIARHEASSPLVLKAKGLGGKPLAVNRREEFTGFAEALSGAATSKLLLVPIFAVSRMAGFVDARDKGRKLSFEERDLAIGRKIGADLLRLVRMTGIVADMEEQEERPPRRPPVPAPVAPTESAAGLTLDEVGLTRLHSDLSTEMAREAGLVALGLTVVNGDSVGAKLLFADGAQDEDRSPLLHHQADALRRAGFDPPAPDRWLIRSETVARPLDSGSSPRVIGSEVLLARGAWGLTISAMGLSDSGAVPRVVGRIGRKAAEVSADAARRYSRRKMAVRLLRPGDKIHPELEKHARATSRLAWLVARHMGGSDGFAEDAALAGMLHDLGMVDLDYDGLYRHPAPGAVEKRIFRGHSEAGERRLAEIGMEVVAEAVRHHHERWDGAGYPDRLAGANIPPLSRIVHAAEVFDVLTSASSYRRPISPDRAMTVLRNEADRQFDPRVVEALAAVVGSGAAVE